ncbi:MAG: hypothetical protein J3K34DRAFT_445584 [Monoraphidium minutum]|nr:MAG: hypothetical protein J3K34DRAFT_445584 [Monoraphidium minutum]
MSKGPLVSAAWRSRQSKHANVPRTASCTHRCRQTSRLAAQAAAAHALHVRCRGLGRHHVPAVRAMATPSSGAAAAGGGEQYQWQSTCMAEAGGGQAQIAPAAENNKDPILAVLARHLGPLREGAVLLEVASGTGQHAAHLARGLPGVTLQPSDVAPDLFPSIAAHTQGLANVRRPVVLDATWPPQRWAAALGGGPEGGLDGVQVANMTHIAPWAATQGLVAGAAALLRPGGLLTIYGPFKLRGQFTTDSNRAFHERLVASNPEWGYRGTDEVDSLARRSGLEAVAVEAMPANNFMLVFRRGGGGGGGG